MPVPAPTAPSAIGHPEAAATARPASLGLDLNRACLAEVAVVALADDRDQDFVHPHARIGGQATETAPS